MTVGKVYLVGAGPGDPRLISLRGVECLQAADVVLYDGLVNPLLLRHTRATAERTSRMNGPDGRRLDQAEINRRLVADGLAGKTVVRLKGGDPYIFGRGSEEAAALAEASVPFEVVPGITAAVAAAEYAGLSLTHRDHASMVTFITGHEDPTKPASRLDYRQLAQLPGTLVFYMGLHRLPAIVHELLSHGKPADTPACVISRGTTPLQRTVTGTLHDLESRVNAAGLQAPSLIIVGHCVNQREQLAWFEQQPLFGQTIAITRPEAQADSAIQQAVRLGAAPLLLPTIEIHPPAGWQTVDATLEKLAEFDWLIFTSSNGVRSLLDRLWETGGDARRLSHLKLAAIGPHTAEVLTQRSLRADVVPDVYRAEALAAALVPMMSGQRVLWAGADRGRDVLPTELSSAGAEVTKLVVYRNRDATTVPPATQAQLDAGTVSWIALSSPSIARNLTQLIGPVAAAHLGTRTRLASISPVTTAAAKECGLLIAAEATQHDWPGLFTAIATAE